MSVPGGSGPPEIDGSGPRPPLPSQLSRLHRPAPPAPAVDPELRPEADASQPEPAADASEPEPAAEPAADASEPEPAAEPPAAEPEATESEAAGSEAAESETESEAAESEAADLTPAESPASLELSAADAVLRRRYEGLMVEVELLERRIRSGALPPEEATAAVGRTRDNLATAQVVGDLALLGDRLDQLQGVIEARRAKRKAERARALDAARATKETLVAEAEAIAQGSDWRAASDRLRAMIDEWKALPRLDRRADDELWKRFSSARTTYTRRRRAHFAELAEKRDDAKSVKERLATEAETLASSTDWAPTAARYRALMTEWKAAGPAPRADEDSLWQRFRAAQDAFFTARSATLSERDSGERESLQVKERLLVEAETLLPVTDLAAAKAALRSIQDQWNAAGRVPRDATVRVEGRLRKVEEAVRAREQGEWQRTSPAALARAEATVAQLRASVEKLERQAAAAQAAGSTKAEEDARTAVETRRSWLVEAEKTLADLRR